MAQRLKEITVDVKTVTLPKMTTSTTELPKPAVDLRPGTYNYKASIALGGQTIPLTMKSEIKEENGAWTVTDTAQTPQAEVADISTIEKGSLLLKRRVIKQGPMTMEINVEPNPGDRDDDNQRKIHTTCRRFGWRSVCRWRRRF